MISHIGGNTFSRCQLSERGFVPGAQVRVLARMPFKGPIILLLHGAKVALRLQDAEAIYIYSHDREGVPQ